MAANFRISVCKKSNGLNLYLRGDFDGTSAFELLNVLQDKSTDAEDVFIDTSGLNEIHPFGRDIFQKNFYRLRLQSNNLVFTGKASIR